MPAAVHLEPKSKRHIKRHIMKRLSIVPGNVPVLLLIRAFRKRQRDLFAAEPCLTAIGSMVLMVHRNHLCEGGPHGDDHLWQIWLTLHHQRP